jgi:hypothetical protein
MKRTLCVLLVNTYWICLLIDAAWHLLCKKGFKGTVNGGLIVSESFFVLFLVEHILLFVFHRLKTQEGCPKTVEKRLVDGLGGGGRRRRRRSGNDSMFWKRNTERLKGLLERGEREGGKEERAQQEELE